MKERGRSVLKKNIWLTIIFCSFLVSFKKVESTDTPLDKDESKKTTFKLVENRDGLSVYAESLYFGTHELNNEDLKIKAINDTSVNVTEITGKRTGWTLKAKLDKFEDQGHSINGAALFFPAIKPVTTTGGTASINPPLIYDDDVSFIGNVKGTSVQVSSNSVKLAQANSGEGYGEWELPYVGDDKVQLNIPRGQKEGQYLAELTYTLEEGPVP